MTQRKKREIRVSLPPEIVEKLKMESFRGGCWPNAIVEQALGDYFARVEAEQKLKESRS